MKQAPQNRDIPKRAEAPQSLSPSKIGLAFLLLTGVAAGTWAIGRGKTSAAPQNANTQNAAVKSIAANAGADEASAPFIPSGNSLSDQMIIKWATLARKDPKDDAAWGNLGDSYMQKARETADVTYYAHAEKSYQRALEVRPNSVPALNGLAWVNSGRHEFETSIAFANKALEISPRDNEAIGLIGDADVEMGSYDAAYKHYQQMLDIRPDTSSYSRGAHLLWLMGQERQAMLLMLKAIKAGGPYAENTAWCRAQLAIMLMNGGMVLPAEQVLQEGLKYAPHNYQMLAAMGRLKAAKNDYPAAIEYYKQAVAGVPTHDAVVALGDLYQLTDKPDEARKQYALVEATHQLMKANGVRGDMQIAHFYADHDRNLPDALRDEEAEYKTRPNVYVADTLAWCYYKAGRYEEAANMIQKALAHRTPEALFKFHQGMIELKRNHVVSAQQHLYEALNQNPHFSLLYAPVAADTLKQIGSHPPTFEQAPASQAAAQSASSQAAAPAR